MKSEDKGANDMSTPPQNSLVNRNPALGSPFARKMRNMGSYLRQHWVLYLMLIPGLFFLFLYKLLPLWGLQIAFKDFKIFSAETQTIPYRSGCSHCIVSSKLQKGQGNRIAAFA